MIMIMIIKVQNNLKQMLNIPKHQTLDNQTQNAAIHHLRMQVINPKATWGPGGQLDQPGLFQYIQTHRLEMPIHFTNYYTTFQIEH